MWTFGGLLGENLCRKRTTAQSYGDRKDYQELEATLHRPLVHTGNVVSPERVMVEKSAGRNKKSGLVGLLFLPLLVPFRVGVEEVLFPALADEENHVSKEEQNTDCDEKEVRSEKIYYFRRHSSIESSMCFPRAVTKSGVKSYPDTSLFNAKIPNNRCDYQVCGDELAIFNHLVIHSSQSLRNTSSLMFGPS
jgi:hypothetical protein